MTEPHAPAEVLVTRFVRARRDRAFAAWTDPAVVVRWWGPAHVTCTHAEIDLRVGGGFRIANRLPDGSTLWISGTYEVVEPPDRLVHSWRVGPATEHPSERVTVEFRERDGGTEIEVRHTGIPTPELRLDHEQGWTGCLAGLQALLARPSEHDT